MPITDAYYPFTCSLSVDMIPSGFHVGSATCSPLVPRIAGTHCRPLCKWESPSRHHIYCCCLFYKQRPWIIASTWMNNYIHIKLEMRLLIHDIISMHWRSDIMMSNWLHPYKLWDVITHPWPTILCGLAKLLLKFGHGWVIASINYNSLHLLIHDLTHHWS